MIEALLVIFLPVVLVATWIAYDAWFSRRPQAPAEVRARSNVEIRRADGRVESQWVVVVHAKDGSKEVEFCPPIVLNKGDKLIVPGLIDLE